MFLLHQQQLSQLRLRQRRGVILNGMFTNANSYEWAVDGVVFSTEANPTWTASTEGIYNIEVTVRSEDGCSASDNMVAEVSKFKHQRCECSIPNHAGCLQRGCVDGC